MADSPLSQISSLMPLIEKIATDTATKIVNTTLQQAQYQVPKVPDHHHNNTDSIQLGPDAISSFAVYPAVTGKSGTAGVFAPSTLVDQVVIQPPNGVIATSNTTNKFSIYGVPLPIIYGFGDTTLQFTGALAGGATSGNLTGAWQFSTTTVTFTFSNFDTRRVTLTNGSAHVTWTSGLSGGGATAIVSVVGSPMTFVGGDASLGSAVLFVNPSNAVQLFFRIDRDGYTNKWWGINLTVNETT